MQHAVPCQGRERRPHSPGQKGPSGLDDQARRAATSLAFSRHPDLAEAPVLDVSLDPVNDPALDGLVPQRQKRTAAATAFVPLAVTPAVERMLQVCSWRNCMHTKVGTMRILSCMCMRC